VYNAEILQTSVLQNKNYVLFTQIKEQMWQFQGLAAPFYDVSWHYFSVLLDCRQFISLL
jgi:hypothetical protein